MSLLDSEAAERGGISWTVTNQDHPAMAIMTNPEKLYMGSMSVVGLKKETVRESL